MKRRVLGKTGNKLSIVGFGGIIVMDESAERSERYVARAVERGINYFDVAPDYGNAEVMLGPALKPYRNDVFLACKTIKRTAAEAWQELQRSLKRLHTAHFDLYQLHGLITMEEVDAVTGKGGALETFQRARREGTIRYIGFSAHTEEAALAVMDRFDFDSILFPFNWSSWFKQDFGPKVLQKAKEQGIGRLALKAFAKRKWKDEEEAKKWPKCWYAPVESREEADLALRFTLSLPVTAAVSSSHMELLEWACDIADKFTPITEPEEAQLRQKSQKLDTIFPEEEEVP